MVRLKLCHRERIEKRFTGERELAKPPSSKVRTENSGNNHVRMVFGYMNAKIKRSM